MLKINRVIGLWRDRVIRHRVSISSPDQESKPRNRFLFPVPCSLFPAFFLVGFVLFSLHSVSAQDWVQLIINKGTPIRLASPDFKPATNDPQTAPLNTVFNQTLWSDLDNSGIFEMVSRSFYPLQTPGSPGEVQLNAWSSPPPNASFLAFGNLGVSGGKLQVQGWLFDAKNTAAPQILGKQYQEAATAENSRLIAHRFADEIIFRLGGGIQGVAESRIFYVSSRSGSKEVWAMDYDGAGQQQLTHLNSIALSPRVSPDGSRVAFSGLTKDSWQILLYSLDLGRLVSLPRFGGDNFSPAWSSDGSKIAWSSSMRTGDPEIYLADATGSGPKRLTASKGSDVSPV